MAVLVQIFLMKQHSTLVLCRYLARVLPVTIVALLIVSNIMAQFSTHRQLLIFKNVANAQIVTQQLTLLKQSAAGVLERDIRVNVVEVGDSLAAKYKIDPSLFTVILVGKDRGEKYRTNKLLQTDQLFSIIDAMPMRKAESRKN